MAKAIPEFPVVVAGEFATDCHLRSAKMIQHGTGGIQRQWEYSQGYFATYTNVQCFVQLPLENALEWEATFLQKIESFLSHHTLLRKWTTNSTASLGINDSHCCMRELTSSIIRVTTDNDELNPARDGLCSCNIPILAITPICDYRPNLDCCDYKLFTTNLFRFQNDRENPGKTDFTHETAYIGSVPIACADCEIFPQTVANPFTLGKRAVERFLCETMKTVLFMNGTGNFTTIFLGQERDFAQNMCMMKAQIGCRDRYRTLALDAFTESAMSESRLLNHVFYHANLKEMDETFFGNFGYLSDVKAPQENGILMCRKPIDFFLRETQCTTSKDRYKGDFFVGCQLFLDHHFNAVRKNFPDTELYRRLSCPKTLANLLMKLEALTAQNLPEFSGFF